MSYVGSHILVSEFKVHLWLLTHNIQMQLMPPVTMSSL